MSLLSIDIGSTAMHIAEGDSGKGGVHILRSAVVPVPAGCVADGSVRDGNVLSQVLADALIKNKFRSRSAVVTTDAVDAVVRDIELPRAKPRELEGMIRGELLQTYHISASNVLQYRAVEEVPTDGGAALTRYRAAALDGDMVEGYHALLRQTKLKPLYMDLNLNAMSKLFSLAPDINGRPIPRGAAMYVDFGASHASVYVNIAGRQQFYRHLKIGSGEIERRIAGDTFTPAEDSLKKKESGFNFFSGEGAAEKYFTILRPLFSGFAEELRKIMSFYVGRSSRSPVERIFLFGGGCLAEGLPEYLEAQLNVPTERIRSVSAASGGGADALSSCLNAAAALIRI